MENTTPPGNAMNDFDSDEKERLENWRALQISLGLVPDELPVPAAEMTAPPPPRSPEPVAPAPQAKSADDAIIESVAAEMLRPAEPVEEEPTPLPPGEQQEVEVGEAPEEVPEEPGEEPSGPGEKKRRRRRRRRRRGAGEGAAEGAAADNNGEPAAAGMPGASAEPPLVDAGDDEEEIEGEDDEDEVEPIAIPDWNVPTWQELIDALYRPER